MGANSAGKTTLALILAGLAPEMTGGKLRGQAMVDGLDAAATAAVQLSAHLGLVFQEPERQLFNMTVADEVAFGLEGLGLPPAAIRARIAWVLGRVGLTGLEERAPWQLSGGQQKRLAIATILALRPSILVLDEPMAGLDPLGRREIAAVLAELKAETGATVIVLEKDAEFVARWAERLVVLAEGRAALDGSASEVFQQVDRLHKLGVAVPQAAELAAVLRREGVAASFLTAQDAAVALSPRLSALNSSLGVGAGSPSPAATPPSRPAVDVRSVSFTYDGGTRALDDISLAVPQGQFVALVGPNGGGKSTLARHLNGLLRPQTGSVAINGQPTARQAVGELARQVGYVFQNPDHQIFAPTVREEIAFGPRNLGLRSQALNDRVAQALAVFSLDDAEETPPAVLGYGMRRLVTVASVWAMQPAIWVLDEPTTGLDAHHTRILMSLLRDLHATGRTILFITHDLRLAAEAADRVIVIDQGHVAMDGSPSQVLADAQALARVGLRPPPITRLSAALAPHGFPHPALTVEQFAANWRGVIGAQSTLTRDDSPAFSSEAPRTSPAGLSSG
jgi:cobalt transport protein ATP-binding subunit